MIRRLAETALALLFVICALAPANAQSKPDSALLQSMLHAGGPPKFSSVTLFGVLTGKKETGELVTLTRKFGADGVRSFFAVFDFVISDASAYQMRAHIKVDVSPAPDPEDGRALAAALYAAGKGTDNHFSAGQMLDRLFAPSMRDAVQKDAAKKFGAHAGAQFTASLTQLMNDLKAQYSL
jgi:hypothetical protein